MGDVEFRVRPAADSAPAVSELAWRTVAGFRRGWGSAEGEAAGAEVSEQAWIVRAARGRADELFGIGGLPFRAEQQLLQYAGGPRGGCCRHSATTLCQDSAKPASTCGPGRAAASAWAAAIRVAFVASLKRASGR